jgi:hypothetical protein
MRNAEQCLILISYRISVRLSAPAPTGTLLDEVAMERPALLIAFLQYVRGNPFDGSSTHVGAAGQYVVDGNRTTAEWLDSVRWAHID